MRKAPRFRAGWAEEAQAASATFPKRPILDVKVGEAVAYLITNSWGLNFVQAHDRAYAGVVPEFDVVPEFRRFVQAAADGLLTVWGRRSLARPYEPIPPAFWIENDVSFSSLIKDEAESEPRNDRDLTQARYIRLMASRVELERFFHGQPPELIRAKSVARQLAKLHEAGVEERQPASRTT